MIMQISRRAFSSAVNSLTIEMQGTGILGSSFKSDKVRAIRASCSKIIRVIADIDDSCAREDSLSSLNAYLYTTLRRVSINGGVEQGQVTLYHTPAPHSGGYRFFASVFTSCGALGHGRGESTLSAINSASGEALRNIRSDCSNHSELLIDDVDDYAQLTLRNYCRRTGTTLQVTHHSIDGPFETSTDMW